MNELNSGYWKGKKVLVTGISGFVGSYLAEKLLELDADVYGIVRRHAVPEYPNISHIHDKLTLYDGSITDYSSIRDAIDNSQAETVFHLAAQSFVPTSIRAPLETYQINVLGTANLLDAVRKSETVERVQFASSSETYGLVLPTEIPIRETNPLRPLSPYGASKAACDLMCYTHFKTYQTPVIRTRAFNHCGPRRGLQFITSVITRQIAKAKLGRTKKIVIGNPEPKRDFTDVRDMIIGYLLSIEKGEPGEVYNLGSGKSISIGDLVELAIEVGGLKGKVTLEQDKSRYRKADVMILECDASKAKKNLGWVPQISLNQTLKDMIDYFEKQPELLDIEAH